MTARDSRGVEIAEGARVRHETNAGSWEYVVKVAEADRHGRIVAVRDDGSFVLLARLALTVIPDTVEVTVELPRSDLPGVSHYLQRLAEWDEARLWLDGAWYEVLSYGDEDAEIRRMDPQPTARFRAAVRGHPGSQEGEG